jgi:hypothetical protein
MLFIENNVDRYLPAKASTTAINSGTKKLILAKTSILASRPEKAKKTAAIKE